MSDAVVLKDGMTIGELVTELMENFHQEQTLVIPGRILRIPAQRHGGHLIGEALPDATGHP